MYDEQGLKTKAFLSIKEEYNKSIYPSSHCRFCKDNNYMEQCFLPHFRNYFRLYGFISTRVESPTLYGCFAYTDVARKAESVLQLTI